MVTGRYWHHLKPELPADEAMDVAFQDKMVARLQELTGVALRDGNIAVKKADLHRNSDTGPLSS